MPLKVVGGKGGGGWIFLLESEQSFILESNRAAWRGDQEPLTDKRMWHYAESNLVPRVSRHHHQGGGKMRDPGNKVAQWEVRGIQASGRDGFFEKVWEKGECYGLR